MKHQGLLISLFISLIAFVSASNPVTSCYGISRLTELNGELFSHTGDDNYFEKVTCIWEIFPESNETSIDKITLVFKRFGLEFSWDFLKIYAGNSTTGSPFVSLTGNESPGVLEIPSSTAVIVFTSDDFITSIGFHIQYWAEPCSLGCENGHCINGSCSCFAGWQGLDCSIAFCENDCSSVGICRDNRTCACPPGYYGADCSAAFCDKLSILEEASGTFSDHWGNSNYRPNTNCTWRIVPQVESTFIFLQFLSFDVELDDSVVIYAGDSTNLTLIGTFSGFRNPSPIYVNRGQITVVFTSNGELQRSGFSIQYSTHLDKCPNNCSDNGVCNLGTCLCSYGYSGLDCSEPYCPNNCSKNGNCINGTCECNPDWMGVDCSVCSSIECTQCPPSYNLTSTNSGYILGDGCLNWNMTLSNSTYLILELEKFSENGSLALLGDNFTTIAYFNGRRKFPPLLLSGAQTSILKFQSSVNSTSYLARYSAYACPNQCSGNGVCYMGLCKCFLGFTGASCSLPDYCYNNCTSNGLCVNSTCQCFPGFYGKDCASTYCSGLTVLTSSFGSFSDHSVGIKYKPRTNCSILIQPDSPASSLTLLFNLWQLEPQFDYITIYDGNSTSASAIRYSGSWYPNPFLSTSGSLLLNFISNNLREYSGFTLQYASNNLCPQSCSQRGYCVPSAQGNFSCICMDDWAGESCNRKVVPKRLELGIKYTEVVKEWKWSYYYVELQQTVGELMFDVSRKSNRGDPEFYLKFGSPPILKDTLNLFQTTKVMKIPQVGKWYLGIFARKGTDCTDTQISVTVLGRCPNNCSGRGKCVDSLYCECDDPKCFNAADCSVSQKSCSSHGVCSDGSCQCSPGYKGPVCELSNCSPICENGGVCRAASNNTWECDCSETGYIGPTCSQPLPFCNPTCQKGECIFDNYGRPVCNCTATGYSGVSCESPICQVPCRNGGFCQHPNTCFCPKGFAPPNCENSVQSADQAEQGTRIIIGLVISLCAVIAILGSIFILVSVHRLRRNSPVAGAAGSNRIVD